MFSPQISIVPNLGNLDLEIWLMSRASLICAFGCGVDTGKDFWQIIPILLFFFPCQVWYPEEPKDKYQRSFHTRCTRESFIDSSREVVFHTGCPRIAHRDIVNMDGMGKGKAWASLSQICRMILRCDWGQTTIRGCVPFSSCPPPGTSQGQNL